MPEICRFFGIIIRMFFDGKRSALSYQPSAPEGAAYRIRAERSRLPFEAEC